MRQAISYMRCSGVGQVSGDTWNRQDSAIQQYATANDIELVGEYRDEGISGRTELENRPGLAACLERVENNGVKLVLVESADRLARDAMISELIVREFQRADGVIIAASSATNLTDGDDSNPTAKLVRQILSAIAEFDRCVTVLKLRAARQRIKAKQGKCEGRKGFGRDSREQAILEFMRANKVIGPTKLAALLNANNLKPRAGNKWYACSVSRILKRERIA